MEIPSRKETQSAIKGLTGIRKELEKERNRMKSSVKRLRKNARDGSVPSWTPDVVRLYGSKDYSFLKLIKLLRKNKVL